MNSRAAEFTAFVSARSSSLLRTARLLSKDMSAAEDLLQTALAKTYTAWGRVGEDGAERYLRRSLVTSAVDESRRPWRREHATQSPPERTDTSLVDDVGQRLVLLDALSQLPPQQRAAVVLRHYLDVSVAEAAQLLRCSEGTVKSNAARGLVRLRSVLQQTRGES